MRIFARKGMVLMPKKSYNFYLSPEANDMIDSSIVPSDTRSRSEFVEKAIRSYAASLSSEMHKELLSEELVSVIRDNIRNAEKHIASTIFKLAGEQATLSLIFADSIVGEMSHKDVDAYRNEAYNIVRKRHGVFTFDDALYSAEKIAGSD